MAGPVKRACLAVLLALAWALPASAEGILARGRVLGPDGAPLAGVLVSDEHRVVLSGADGSFSLRTWPERVVFISPPGDLMTKGRWWWPAEDAAGQGLTVHLMPRRPHRRPRRSKGPDLAVLADPHLYAPKALPLRGPPKGRKPSLPMRTWAGLAQKLTALNPALTLVAGDLCADGDQGNDSYRLRAQLRLAKRAMAMLPRPARALPGNHDVIYQSGGRRGVYLWPWRRIMGPARQVVFSGGLAVICLDNLGQGVGPGGKSGYTARTSKKTLAWVRRVLKVLPPQTPLVVASHYPLISPLAGLGPLKPGATARAGRGRPALGNLDQSGPKLLGLFKGRALLALLHGHLHAGYSLSLRLRGLDLLMIGVPAVSGGWWKGDRRWLLGGFPPGFVLADVIITPQGPRLKFRLEELGRPLAPQGARP